MGAVRAFRARFHPLVKYFGLMSAKNAAVNFIILCTLFILPSGSLFYRSRN